MSRILTPSKETLGQHAYRELRQQILDGRLAPGQRLSLRAVAGALMMSMAPVGEALRELARDGLVESEPGWGARVRMFDRDALRNQHILRIALECETSRQCSERATSAQFDELEEIAAELDRQVERHASPKQVSDLDSRFHLRIAQFSGVASLVEALKANQFVRLLARGSVIAHDIKRPPRDHGLLVDAIRSRDLDQAERAMRDHCVRSMLLQLAHHAARELES